MVSGEDRVEVMPLVAESRGRVEKVTVRLRGQRTKGWGGSAPFLFHQASSSVSHGSLVSVA